MTGKEYQKLAMRTYDHLSNYKLGKAIAKADDKNMDFGGFMMACLGLSGEVGEFNDTIKKVIFHELEFDEEHLKKELGDICWYIAMMCEALNWKLDNILSMNIDKLKKRYPDGFDAYKANHKKDWDV